jgi:hypothetical protein
MLAADLRHRAVKEHHGDAEQVVGGHPVFQAMGPAGIHGDVAGDGAGELARRVRGVEEALMGHRLADAEIGDAGLNPGGAALEVHVENPVHLGDAEHDGVRLGDRPAAQGRARPAGHDLDPVVIAEPHDRRDLLRGGGQHHGEGHLAIGREAVRLEGPPLVLRHDEGLGGDEAPEPLDDFFPARQDRLIRLWKCDRHGTSP